MSGVEAGVTPGGVVTEGAGLAEGDARDGASWPFPSQASNKRDSRKMRRIRQSLVTSPVPRLDLIVK
jgi:hypothetical protein